jgi:hypothetical protein
MTARFNRRWAVASRANLALALSLLTAGSALAAPGTPEQRGACTTDVYRLCPGEIPNVRAVPKDQRRLHQVSGNRIAVRAASAFISIAWPHRG